MLIEHPEVWQQLTSDPGKYLPTFCEEVLRSRARCRGSCAKRPSTSRSTGVHDPGRLGADAPLRRGEPRRAHVRVPGRHRPRPRSIRGGTSPSASAPTTASAPRWRGASCSTASRRSSTWSRRCGSSRGERLHLPPELLPPRGEGGPHRLRAGRELDEVGRDPLGGHARVTIARPLTCGEPAPARLWLTGSLLFPRVACLQATEGGERRAATPSGDSRDERDGPDPSRWRARSG